MMRGAEIFRAQLPTLDKTPGYVENKLSLKQMGSNVFFVVLNFQCYFKQLNGIKYKYLEDLHIIDSNKIYIFKLELNLEYFKNEQSLMQSDKKNE